MASALYSLDVTTYSIPANPLLYRRREENMREEGEEVQAAARFVNTERSEKKEEA